MRECSNCRRCDVDEASVEPETLWCTFWHELVAEFDAADCPVFTARS